jgi:hypothetical protein
MNTLPLRSSAKTFATSAFKPPRGSDSEFYAVFSTQRTQRFSQRNAKVVVSLCRNILFFA